MKVFIFVDVNQVSDNYHSGGGLVVIAETKERVIEMIEKEKYIELTDKDWEEAICYPTTIEAVPEIYTFPDAGCC